MRVLALMPALFDTSPGQRYRLEQWDPLLRERGVEITYEPFEDEELHALLYKPGLLGKKLQLVTRNLNRRLSLVRKVKDYDLVYILREAALLGPPVFERLIHQQRVPIVFDFDDAVFVSYRSPSNGYLELSEICLEDENYLPHRVARDGRKSVSRRLRATGERSRDGDPDDDRHGKISRAAAQRQRPVRP